MVEPFTDAASTASEQPQIPYRWGYFQGLVLIPFSLFLGLGVVGEQLQPHHEPWFVATLTFLIAMVGPPLGVGLLMKKRFAWPLLHIMCGLSFLLICVKVPLAVMNFTSEGTRGSAFFEAELLLVWLFSFAYYRKRRALFQ
jgi:predicted membrane metal-binding protein